MFKIVIAISLLFLPLYNVLTNEWKEIKVSDGFIYDFHSDDNNLYVYGENGLLKVFDTKNNEFNEFTATHLLERYFNVFSTDSFLFYHAYNYNDRYSRVYKLNKDTWSREIVVNANYSIVATYFISNNEFLYSKYNVSSGTSNLLRYNQYNQVSDTLLSTQLSPINNQMNVIISVLGIGRDTIIAGSQGGKIAVSFDSGDNWEVISVCNQDIWRIKVFNGKYWIFTGTNNEIYVSDNLKNWSRVLSEYSFTDIPNAFYVSDDAIYIVSNIRNGLSISNVILKSIDNGVNWDVEIIDNKYSFISIAIFHQKCFIGTRNGSILFKENFLSFIEDISTISNKKLAIFPNPASEYIEICFHNDSFNDLNNKFHLFNSFGVLIGEYGIANSTKLDISNLSKGLYFIRFNGYYGRFIKD